MKWKIKHKTEGWTGTAEIIEEDPTSWSSHHLGFTVLWSILQDPYKPDGSYVEDPDISSLNELEFLERVE